MLENFLRDLRQALRGLRKAPAFAATTILTLALGIGATTAIFTLVHAVMMKSLAVADPDQLYRIGKRTRCCVWGGFSQEAEFSIFSYDLYKYLRDNDKKFEELAAFQAGQNGLGVRRAGTSGVAQTNFGEFVSGNYFSMFGLHAYRGRTLTPADDQRNATPVAVMSYRLWQARYGADPSILNSVFNLDGHPFTIVGIAPPGFFGDQLRDSPPDFFLPLSTEPFVQGDSSLLNRKRSNWLDIIGRLRPGVSPQSARSELVISLKQWLRSNWGDMSANERLSFPDQTLYLSPGGAGITSMREQYEHWLQILMTVAAFVLLIVCANVANLMLVRGLERRQQTSLSMALGAQARRMIVQALTESVLLSILGGLAGLVIAFLGARLILHYAFPPMPGFSAVPIDSTPSMPVLLFAFAVSFLTGIAFGLAPAWLAAKADPIEALRGANRSTRNSGSLPRKLLVIFQAALSLVLLSASGLLTAALHNLETQNFGFKQDRRTVVNVDPLLAGYRADQLEVLYRRLRENISAIPGISSVAICMYSPQSGDSWNSGIYIDGKPAPGPKDDNSAGWDRVSNGFFDVIGTDIVKGRGITERDTNTTTHVAVVNQAFVRRFFPHEDPIGKYFGQNPSSPRSYEIVGVVKDARYMTENLEKPIAPFFFLPESQFDVYPKAEDTQGDLRSHYAHDIVIVTSPGSEFPVTQVRRAIASIDSNMPINFIRTMTEQVSSQFGQQRLIARLTSLFGFLSLLLAAIGIYGVTAFSVGRRTNEIGVRMALGADRGHIVTLILRGAFALILLGLLVGLPLTFWTGQFLGAQLYGLNPNNLAVTLSAIVSLAFSALIASVIPAWRASRISPLNALRSE